MISVARGKFTYNLPPFPLSKMTSQVLYIRITFLALLQCSADSCILDF